MNRILQRHLPFDLTLDARLPGVQPLDLADWLIVDDAYAAQMDLRARLLVQMPDAVLHHDRADTAALAELLDIVLSQLQQRPDFHVTQDQAHCPDGRIVTLDRSKPLQTLNALVQEDFCLLQKPDGAAEHHLSSALLCFPANWLLAQKVGRGLDAIHAPVAGYAWDLAKRVQRLFDGVRPGQGLWRHNALWYDDPALHQPRAAHAQRPPDMAARAPFMRIERQSILRLPQSGYVVFSIHTFVMARADVIGLITPLSV